MLGTGMEHLEISTENLHKINLFKGKLQISGSVFVQK